MAATWNLILFIAVFNLVQCISTDTESNTQNYDDSTAEISNLMEKGKSKLGGKWKKTVDFMISEMKEYTDNTKIETSLMEMYAQMIKEAQRVFGENWVSVLDQLEEGSDKLGNKAKYLIEMYNELVKRMKEMYGENIKKHLDRLKKEAIDFEINDGGLEEEINNKKIEVKIKYGSKWKQAWNKYLMSVQEKAELLKLQEKNQEPDEGEMDEEERGFWKKFGKAVKKVSKNVAKKAKKAIKANAKKAIKKGLEILKKEAFKVDPLKCTGKSCRSCFGLKKPVTIVYCLEGSYYKSDAGAMIKVKVFKEDKPEKSIVEEDIKLGDKAAKCPNLPLVGRLCFKGLEGRSKSSKGRPCTDMCLVVVLKDMGIGTNLCVQIENGKMRFNMKPGSFAATQTEEGDLVAQGEDEDEGEVIDLDLESDSE